MSFVHKSFFMRSAKVYRTQQYDCFPASTQKSLSQKTNDAETSWTLFAVEREQLGNHLQILASGLLCMIVQIFYNIAKPGEKYLALSDFLDFLPEEQATRAFGLFELNDAGHITKKSLMKWVVNVYKERRSLALTLSDNRTVVAKLHRVLDVVRILPTHQKLSSFSSTV